MTEIRHKNTFKTDWIASNPIFYHELTHQISENINDVIDFSNLEFDADGLRMYLDFGYAILGRTPVKHVRFLPPNSHISVVDGKLDIRHQPDDVINLLNKPIKEADTLSLIEERIHAWEQTFTDDILIPTSGGLDSRLLNVMVKDKSRIRAYTYGASDEQNRSKEVVYARKLTELLNIPWKQVDLGYFHQYFEEEFDLFGPSSGAWGNYHIEFFTKIRQAESKPMHLLSGIIGDVWAGAVTIKPIQGIANIRDLGYTHGMFADSSQLVLPSSNEPYEQFYEQERHHLNDPLYRIVTAMRLKLMLLCSLYRIPRHFQYQPWSPFLDKGVALAMLNLPAGRRNNRLWQRDFFKKNGVNLEDMHLRFSTVNSLNIQALKMVPLAPLNVELLKEIVRPQYVAWINGKIGSHGFFRNFYQKMHYTRKVKEGLKLLGLKNYYLQAYFAYLSLKPLEQLLIKRQQQ